VVGHNSIAPECLALSLTAVFIFLFILNVAEIAAVEMEHDGVGDTEVDVNFLSDQELAQKLRHLGANIGPITGRYWC